MKKTKTARIIFHVDMNSFYASVECSINPDLRGKPLAIAGNVEERRGIVVTSSYEARAQGVHTTMTVWEAKQKCPGLIVMPPSFERYRTASRKMFNLLSEYTDLIEPISIDEGYMDVTERYSDHSPIEMAEEIQNRLMNELHLPCSIGIAPNKFLAKMASDMKKPLGITILRKRELPGKLWPLPIEEMHGVGKKTMEKFHKMNIYTIGDLASRDLQEVKLHLGKNGEKLWNRSKGIDDRPVDPEASNEFKSVGTSTTLPEDIVQIDEAANVLKELSQSLEQRLKRKKVVTTSVQLTIRYADRKTITRSQTFSNPIQQKEELFKISNNLFKEHWDERPVRLLGITATQVIDKSNATRQLDLFSYKEHTKDEQLFETLERINRRYGEQSIQKGIEKKGDVSHGNENETGRNEEVDREGINRQGRKR
ncbi:DNA polymerase IV [Pseudalkalibacillus salsuginis]|uniref:DNA polymerase IV n=1 Tax=Pseudalkalibacillus salsuginis TaxID=2910972 RepID=UPI001F199988|nr:DNA polymerase IV [Pseudalkalibacillus salsuginis]MCF6408359.1 DNA polymerase IV [Pseudalkalibacillus salsuginis]